MRTTHPVVLPFATPLTWSVAVLFLHATAARAEAPRELVVTGDVVLDKDSVLNTRLVVRGSHLTIDGNGATLQGPGTIGDPASLEKAGIGVDLDGVSDVTIRNLKARGFATGLVARRSDALIIEGCDFSDNYHHPGHDWGELPARGGVVFEEVRRSVVRKNQANRVWDGIHLIRSGDNLIERNDFSHCSNTCAKLWEASRNRFLENDLSFGIRINRAAGEVHARDSTGVLIESGSDDNFWFRNNITEGGDGIFIRVLNGWVSRGNLFVENDTSRANNNCIESWSPGNTYIRNKANYGSYGFWLGGSDQTVLIGNEAAYNGLPGGNHNAPENFGHGGIVVVHGSSSHTIISGNWCHHNNGGGLVFQGDVQSKGEAWRTHHWVIQQNRLDHNRWAIWGRWADELWLANNRAAENTEPDQLVEISNLRATNDPSVALAPRAILDGPGRAVVGQPVRFDASRSLDAQARSLNFRWTAGELTGDGPSFTATFTKPGFQRLGLTVDNGVLADLAWRDLVVTDPPREEIGTEGEAARWGFELEGNDGRGRMTFADDADAVVGKSSLRFTANPYPGGAARAEFPADREAGWDFAAKHSVRFWFKTENSNIPGFQNPGPVVTFSSKSGSVRFEPSGGRNLFGQSAFSEARWTWTRLEIPLAGSAEWVRTETGTPDPAHVTRLSLTQDSWGGDPFTVWLDGLCVE